MNTILRYIWFEIFVKAVVLIVLGLNVRNRSRLGEHKQIILIANHNSHLDTMVLMSLFSYKEMNNVRPVAAMDYFLNHPVRRWFAEKIVRIVPLSRHLKSVHTDPLKCCCDALKEGYSLILYPEGTRGDPEKLRNYKTGIAHLLKRFPDIPVVPVFMHGLGKALPKGDFLLVPFYCDIFVGEAFYWPGDKTKFMETLNKSMGDLAKQGNFTVWE